MNFMVNKAPLFPPRIPALPAWEQASVAWRVRAGKTPPPKSWAGDQSDTLLDSDSTEGARGTRWRGIEERSKEERCKIQGNRPQSQTGILKAGGNAAHPSPAWRRPYLHPHNGRVPAAREPWPGFSNRFHLSRGCSSAPAPATCRCPRRSNPACRCPPAGRPGLCAQLAASLSPSAETSLSRGHLPAAGIEEKLFSSRLGQRGYFL